MFRTIGDQPSLWESMLPEEALRLPEELARVDALLDDWAFFAPFAPQATLVVQHGANSASDLLIRRCRTLVRYVADLVSFQLNYCLCTPYTVARGNY